MKREDVFTIIEFVILVLLIILIFGYSLYQDHNKGKIDRKTDYIFKKYTYSFVLKEGSNLFFDTLKLLDNENFDYERNLNESVKYYAINDYNHYKKILNYNNITNTLSSNEVDKFMKDNKIIYHNDNYYIESYAADLNKDYVGSSIDIEKYDDEKVYFKSTNYYCQNSEYIGLTYDEPECTYEKSETNFTVILENDFFRIDSYQEIAKILK